MKIASLLYNCQRRITLKLVKLVIILPVKFKFISYSWTVVPLYHVLTRKINTVYAYHMVTLGPKLDGALHVTSIEVLSFLLV